MSRGRLFVAGMRIGRDHIASAVYTIAFTYAGGSMAVLLLLYFTDRPATALLNAEMFTGGVARTLDGVTDLMLGVPITTGIAALTVASSEPEPRGRHTTGVDVE